MIPPSYLFPVEKLRNGPDPKARNRIASVWPAAMIGGLSGGLVAWLVTALQA
ncbi:MAG: hypothetical protein AAGB11_09990 [Pseudomonadota bacterium]